MDSVVAVVKEKLESSCRKAESVWNSQVLKAGASCHKLDALYQIQQKLRITFWVGARRENI